MKGQPGMVATEIKKVGEGFKRHFSGLMSERSYVVDKIERIGE